MKKRILRLSILLVFLIVTWGVTMICVNANENFYSGFVLSKAIHYQQDDTGEYIYTMAGNAIKKYSVDGKRCDTIKMPDNVLLLPQQDQCEIYNNNLYNVSGKFCITKDISHAGLENRVTQYPQFESPYFFISEGKIYLKSAKGNVWQENQYDFFCSSADDVSFLGISKQAYDGAYTLYKKNIFGSGRTITYDYDSGKSVYTLTVKGSMGVFKDTIFPHCAAVRGNDLFYYKINFDLKYTLIYKADLDGKTKEVLCKIPSKNVTGIGTVEGDIYVIMDNMLVKIDAGGTVQSVYQGEKSKIDSLLQEKTIFRKTDLVITDKNIRYRKNTILTNVLIERAFDCGRYIYMEYKNTGSALRIGRVDTCTKTFQFVTTGSFVLSWKDKLYFLRDRFLTVKYMNTKQRYERRFDYLLDYLRYDPEKYKTIVSGSCMYFYDASHRKLMRMNLDTDKIAVVFKPGLQADTIYVQNLSVKDKWLYFEVDAYDYYQKGGIYDEAHPGPFSAHDYYRLNMATNKVEKIK